MASDSNTDIDTQATARRTVTITEPQAEFLDEHPELNFSALSRNALDVFMQFYDRYDGLEIGACDTDEFNMTPDSSTTKMDDEQITGDVAVTFKLGDSDE